MKFARSPCTDPYDSYCYRSFRCNLLALGYPNDDVILEDEWQAYLVSGGLGVAEDGEVARRVQAIWREASGHIY